MRLLLSRTLGLATVAAVALVAGIAHAQNFNGAAWVALARGGTAIGDAVGPGTSETDVVGNTTNPALFVWSDATDLYLRIRVNDKPTLANDSWKTANWGCLIDTNGVLTNYEYMAVLSGSANQVQWRYNAAQSVGANVPNEPAEVLVGSAATATNARTVDAASAPAFSGNADWFVDIAVPWTIIRAGVAGPPAAPASIAGTPMRFACGTSTTGFHIGTDQATTDAAGALNGTWSEPMVCGDTGCLADTDGDGVPDTIEATFGTSPTKVDTDGDGIADNVELSTGAGPYGPFTGPDSDGDNTRDALDLDSDNDCRIDSLDGASYRNASLPNPNTSTNCPSNKPVCKTTTGTCLACDANRNGLGAATCPFASAPTCHLAGPLAGQCTECTSTETGLCTPAGGPACERTTGKCSKCNGDNGGATSAVCPSTLVPVCNLTGASVGLCTQCSAAKTALCTSATPTCDTSTGSCAACNGDRGGGATHACPSTASPYCMLGGAKVGECGKCTSEADCIGAHTGPLCDVPTGTCTDKDTDGDGLNDTVEVLLGTNPAAADSDGDGIGDLAEVTPPGGGPTEKVDSDNDGMIDARDLDSDNDGILDGAEGADDPDGDTLANFRDPDDDGDGISTATEITDAISGKVSDDVDRDGTKNYYDTDADGDGVTDAAEGRGDDDADRIANYLDNNEVPDAGPGVISNGMDGGGTVATPQAVDDGVIEGTGLICSVSHASGRSGVSWAVIFGLAGLALAGVARSRRRGVRSNR